MGNTAGRSTPPLFVRLLAICASVLGFAANAADIRGEYIANPDSLDSYRLRFTLNAAGTLDAALDRPRYGQLSLRCSDVVMEGDRLSFDVRRLRSSWTGTIQENGAVLDGEMSVAGRAPTRDLVTFHRDTFAPAEKPSAIDGYWFAVMDNVGRSLRTQITVRSDAQGREHCTFDSFDWTVFASQCTNVVHTGRTFTFDVLESRARWTGTLSSNRNALIGTWSQAGRQRPLQFERRTYSEPPPIPPVDSP